MKTCPRCDSGYPDSQISCPTHGLPLNEIRDLKPGMVIRNTYRILRKLGQGGMGAVYLAQHTLMNEPQALKFLSSELSQDQAFTARFLREVRTLRQIRHKNVVDAGNLEPSEDGTLFFSMEYVDGPDLRAFLNSVKGTGFSPYIETSNEAGPLGPEGSLPVPLALHIARQIAEGLGAAHSKGMVHRDIKPENILMARDGDAWLPKIADFGIVATKESSTAYTKTGGTLLTMAYAAPEQWRGTAAAELDGRTDLYALGGLLYEMLTGQTPFHAENYEGWSRQHQTTPPQPPSALRPDLANWQGLDALVLRLLAKDCEDRPKDVAELISLLDAVQRGVPKVRRQTVKEDAGQRSVGTRKGLVSIWIGAVSIVVFFVAAFFAARIFWPKPTTSTQQPPSFTSAEVETQPSSQPAQQKPIELNADDVEFVPVPAITKPGATREPKSPHSKDPKLSVEQSSTAEIEKQAGTFYDQGRYEEARPLFQKVCDGGNMTGCASLGHLYDYGQGVTQDHARAIPLYQKACNAGEMSACTELSGNYNNGAGVAKDYAQARSLAQKACDGGYMDGCAGLGYLYDRGHGVNQDYAQARSLYQKVCDSGSMTGCYGLGRLYNTGHGVSQDYARARALFQKSCDGGYIGACNSLGGMYFAGHGVAQDYSRAAALYTKACDAGDAHGCGNLGAMYHDGHGVTRDDSRAATLLSKACDGGDYNACRYLGSMYYAGNGVEHDYSRAVALYSKACDAGDPQGCDYLGVLYQDGKGVPQDYPRAVALYTKACDASYAIGCVNLGGMYLSGRGVGKDSEKAKELFNKSCSLGTKEGCDRLKKVQ